MNVLHRVFHRSIVCGAFVLSLLFAAFAHADLLSIAQYPLFLTTTVRPNILVIYDNSESMDGTMAGKVIAGDDPTTRGNIARSVIRNTVNAFSSQFNWGLESFDYGGWPGLNLTYGYYLGDETTMNFTNDCINGISMSTGGLRCIPNPDTSNGMQYITYSVTGDDPVINDVLYIWDIGPALYALGSGGTGYCLYAGHSAVTTWNTGDFSNGIGCFGFTPTDAGFLPSTPPYPRQMFVRRAWGYLNNPSGWGTVNEPIASSSDSTHFSRLNALMQPETSDPGSTDIKNAAVFTPLAGSLATARYYFQGSLGGYNSPIQLACQKSFVLLATDGNPTARTDGSMYDLSLQQNNYNASTNAWAFSQAASDVFDQVTPLRTVAVSGNTFDIQTYVVGLGDTVANPSSIAVLNQIASLGGTNSAYLANDSTSLSTAFQAISVDIASKTAAASAVSLNTGSWGTGTNLYQARFNSGDWSGQLISYAVNQDGSLGAQLWDAGQVINGQNWSTGRAILTYKPSAALGARGIAFRWPANVAAPTATEMDTAQSSYLNADMLGVADGYGPQRVAYLRGSVDNESAFCGTCTPSFRSRPTSKLGDIIHSAPTYIAAPAFNYPDTIAGGSYSQFAAANASRTPMIYVGANDGMLHAFEASTGREKLAYVPGSLYKSLSALTTQSHSSGSDRSSHRYYVDGSPTIGDVFYANAWHSLLVGAFSGGGQGVYALDVTDPSAFAENHATQVVRWEFSDADDADLGYAFGQPLVVKTNNGRWSVIVGNGYNNTESDGSASSTGHAVLFVLDAESGAVIAKLDTLAGSTSNPNGMSGPVAVDTNGDGIADAIYAGDLNGNLWKFDISSGTPASWSVAYGQPLFSTPSNQAITVRPDVTKFSQGGYLIVFGTGRYIDTGDNATSWAQSFYGILDNGTPIASIGSLVRQQISATSTGDDGNTYRISTHAVGPATSDNPITGDNQLSINDYYQNKRGWYLPLTSPGERAVTEPSIRAGRVVFNTLIPNTDPCGFGGSGWVMEVDVMTGNRYDTPTFDTNNDKDITAADLVRYNNGMDNTSGRAIASIPAAAGFLRAPPAAGKRPYENKYVNTSAGSVAVIGETAGLGGQGRVSWRQMQ